MDVSLTDFLLYFTLGCFALVPIMAIGSRSLHARTERRALRHRVICRLCLHAFEEASAVKVVDCPVCGAANETGRSRKLG
jgi:rRNA maturation endonuclease Nob1